MLLSCSSQNSDVIHMLQMIIAGYILSIYQFMLEERGQSVAGFTPIRRRGTSSQTQVSSLCCICNCALLRMSALRSVLSYSVISLFVAVVSNVKCTII